MLQGLHHMWLWISLMTQRESPRAVSRKVAEQNAKTVTRNYSNRSSSVARLFSSPIGQVFTILPSHWSMSRTTSTGPWGRHLYNSTGTGETPNEISIFTLENLSG